MEDAILTKIRALLAKAESTEHPAEAEAFTAKAVEMMNRYAIDEAAVRAVAGEKTKIDNRKIFVSNPYGNQKVTLLNVIANRTRCQMVSLGKVANGYMIHIFGRANDIEFVEMLFSSLLVQQMVEIANTPVPAYESAKTFRTSFMQGYMQTIANRLNAINKQTMDQAETSTALVLVNDKAATEAAMADEYANLRTVTKKSTARSGSGFYSGKDAGSRADLGSGKLQGNRKQIQS